MRKLFIVALILALVFASPALARDNDGGSFCAIPEGCDLDGDSVAETPAGTSTGAADDQYVEAPASEAASEYVVAEGTIQKQGITTYQYGTHVLIGESGDLLFALQSDTVALDDYVGERVTLHGTRVPGYQNGAVEGGPDLLEVTRIDGGSPVRPPADEPGTDTPEAGDSGESSSRSKDTAATGVLPDTGGATGGVSVVPLLAINAVLIGSALLVRRIIG